MFSATDNDGRRLIIKLLHIFAATEIDEYYLQFHSGFNDIPGRGVARTAFGEAIPIGGGMWVLFGLMMVSSTRFNNGAFQGTRYGMLNEIYLRYTLSIRFAIDKHPSIIMT